MAEFEEKARFQRVRSRRETELAVLCEIDGEEVWIPKSQIDDDSEIWQDGQTGELVISQRIAEQKGLV